MFSLPPVSLSGPYTLQGSLSTRHSVIIEWGLLIIDFWNIPGIYLKHLADIKLSVIFCICSESLNNVPQIIQLINISMETSSNWRDFVKTKYFQLCPCSTRSWNQRMESRAGLLRSTPFFLADGISQHHMIKNQKWLTSRVITVARYH